MALNLMEIKSNEPTVEEKYACLQEEYARLQEKLSATKKKLMKENSQVTMWQATKL